MTNRTDTEALAELEALLQEAEASEEIDFEALGDQEVQDQVRHWLRLREATEKATELQKDLEAKRDRLGEALAGAYTAKGVKSIKLEGLGRVGTTTNSNPSVKDEEALFRWLRKEGEDGIIKTKTSVHYMTLKAFLNQRQDAGKEVPPDEVVSLTPRKSLTFTREKPKSKL